MRSRFTSKQEKIDRKLYEQNMVKNTNPINQRYNPLMDDHIYEERWGDIKLVNYKLTGDKLYLKKITEIGAKAEILRNGYHVINFLFESDPLSGSLTGIISFRLRIVAHKEREFDKFISNRMGFTIKSKK